MRRAFRHPTEVNEMRDVNKLILLGRLGADPVRRETKKGVPVVNFPVATSRRVRVEGVDSSEVTYEEETQWHQVVAWGRNGENCAQYLGKGDPVFIEGEVRTRKYDDKEGNPRLAFEVHVDEVIFLSRGPRPMRQLDSSIALGASPGSPESSESGGSGEPAVGMPMAVPF